MLERLNSVLDPSRTLTVPEKGERQLETIVAHPSFRLLATMNPGGDFGKKELSPALRNRFTEVWVPAVTAREELLSLLSRTLSAADAPMEEADDPADWDGGDAAEAMLLFVEWLGERRGRRPSSGGPSLRDLLAWASDLRAISPHLSPNLPISPHRRGPASCARRSRGSAGRLPTCMALASPSSTRWGCRSPPRAMRAVVAGGGEVVVVVVVVA